MLQAVWLHQVLAAMASQRLALRLLELAPQRELLSEQLLLDCQLIVVAAPQRPLPYQHRYLECWSSVRKGQAASFRVAVSLATATIVLPSLEARLQARHLDQTQAEDNRHRALGDESLGLSNPILSIDPTVDGELGADPRDVIACPLRNVANSSDAERLQLRGQYRADACDLLKIISIASIAWI